MKLIVAGSRNCDTAQDYKLVEKALNKLKPSEIVSGCAKGPDSFGEWYAKENNISLKLFAANWKLYGRGAGYKRNIQMAEYANSLLYLWDGKSKGTKHMIDSAKKYGLTIFDVKEIQFLNN